MISRELQAQGCDRGISLLKDYIRPKPVLRPSRATVRFETAPGVQLQHDGCQVETVIGGKWCRVHVAAKTLGYSWHFHSFNFIGVPCEDASEHTHESLVRAFEWFGGVVGR